MRLWKLPTIIVKTFNGLLIDVDFNVNWKWNVIKVIINFERKIWRFLYAHLLNIGHNKKWSIFKIIIKYIRGRSWAKCWWINSSNDNKFAQIVRQLMKNTFEMYRSRPAPQTITSELFSSSVSIKLAIYGNWSRAANPTRPIKPF